MPNQRQSVPYRTFYITLDTEHGIVYYYVSKLGKFASLADAMRAIDDYLDNLDINNASSPKPPKRLFPEDDKSEDISRGM